MKIIGHRVKFKFLHALEANEWQARVAGEFILMRPMTKTVASTLRSEVSVKVRVSKALESKK